MSSGAEQQRDSAGGRFIFRAKHRLTKRREFEGVFAAKARASVGAITVYSRPNGLSHPRLGLSVGRRVGPAVVRSRIKRLVREAFRLSRFDLPGGYDLVVSVRAEDGLTLERCIEALVACARRSDEIWSRRARREERGGGGAGESGGTGGAGA